MSTERTDPWKRVGRPARVQEVRRQLEMASEAIWLEADGPTPGDPETEPPGPDWCCPWLGERGLLLPVPDSMGDGELTATLAHLIEQLANQGVYLTRTDHLNDRQLYAALRDILLHAEAAPTSSARGPARFIDLLGDYGEEAHYLYLKYYADEQWRSQWAAEFPLDQIPEKEPPPYDRDRHLPTP